MNNKAILRVDRHRIVLVLARTPLWFFFMHYTRAPKVHWPGCPGTWKVGPGLGRRLLQCVEY